jgi:hypothetical protein
MSKAAAKVLDEPVEIVTEPVTLSLDQRVAGILTGEAHQPSETLSALIAEVDDATDHADQAGREARAVASDPKVIDHGALGRALDAEHTAHRLRNGMAALQQLHKEALARERVTEWHQKCDVFEAMVLKHRAELVPMVRRAEAAELELDSACDAIDDISVKFCLYLRKCDEIERAAPLGEARRLPRPIDGLDIARFMARKVPKATPKVETVDYSLAFRPWRPDPDLPVLTYEERLAAHEQNRIKEDEQRAEIFAERAATQSRIEKESQARSQAAAEVKRQYENGL